MGVFNKTPYTNFHELNLNWIIKKIKEVAADNAYFKQFFKTIEDKHILGVVTKVTENNNNTVKTDYLNESTQQMDNYTVYNKTGTDGAISRVVTPIANRVTTAEGDIDSLETQILTVVQIQLTLPSAVTVPVGATANLLSAVDPATLTKSATLHGDTIPTGKTLYGAVLLWTNSSICSMTNCLVEANNKLTVTVFNPSANPVSASAIRLLLFYK